MGGVGDECVLGFRLFFPLKLGIKRHVAHFDLWSMRWNRECGIDDFDLYRYYNIQS